MKDNKKLLIIRQAKISDLKEIFKLEKLVWKNDSATLESLTKRIEIFPQCFCVVYYNKQLIGMANSALLSYPYKVTEYNQAFFPWERVHNPNGETLLLYCSTVNPEFRNKGIWKEMLNFRINYAKKYKYIKRIWVIGRTIKNKYGPDTASLLEKFGFNRIKKFPMGKTMNQTLLELKHPYTLKL